MKNLETIASFGDDNRYRQIGGGSYLLSYRDLTHLEPDDWRVLLRIDINHAAASPGETERSFSISPGIDPKFSKIDKKGDQSQAQRIDRNIHVLKDTIGLSATRLGLLAPVISGSAAEHLLELRKAKGIVLLPDTNSLYNGTLHWLLNVLRESTLWLLPFVMSLTQIQSREAALKSMLRNMKPTNMGQALRSRAFVNAALGLLERNHHRYQVLELDPSLLRYMKMPDRNGFDSDDSEVLEDRLLIEGVHAILKSTRTRAKQLVVTSDVLLARILSAEGIENICLPVPMMPQQSITNVRYDAWAQTYVGTTLRGLLWDLTHAFGNVRLIEGEQEHFRLSCYWPSKLPEDWQGEKLDVIWGSAAKPVDDGIRNDPEDAPPSATHREPDPTTSATSDTEVQTKVVAETTLSDAAVPQASLPLVLKLGGAAYRLGTGSLEELLSAMPESERPAKGNATRALEVLRRAKMLDYDGKNINARADLDGLESYLRANDLDEISHLFEKYEAYKVVLDFLRGEGALDRDEIHPLLERALNSTVARDASTRLARYHILLGQAWSDGRQWRDGSNRPSQSEFLEAFSRIFDAVEHDNIAKLSDFIPQFCRSARMSPWAVSKAAQTYARLLSADYSLQYAAGGKPTGIDQVLTGSLLDLSEVIVPMDRIEIGGRPVLTLGRVKK